jgi:hypothetical protein
MLLAPAAAGAQEQEKPPLKAEEIEALVAPIALYPDSLLSQVLMASTYPLEVVQAARWVQANPKVTGDAALKAVEKESWDVSVKSLVAFPQALVPMNDKLDWTQKLGDAFLSQKDDVMAAVQKLRQQAHEGGNLKSNEQQKVVVEQAPSTQQTVVKIEPAQPDVIYVPAYDPTVVYGGWPYPAYPPYYWPPPPMYYPGGYFGAGLAFGMGVVTIGAIFGDCDWGNNDINIDVDKAVNIDRNFQSNRPDRGQGQGGRTSWQHDPSHRKGVSYRDQGTRDKYGARVPGADGRRDYRGHTAGGPQVGGGGVGDRGSQVGGGGVGDRGSQVGGGGAGDRGPGASTLPAGPGGGARQDGRGDAGGAFAGVGAGGQTQRDAQRGRASTQSLGASRPSGGARASSGGRAGGGGRRR